MNFDFSKLIAKIPFGQKPKARDRRTLEPVREWSFGVIASLLLVFLGGLFSYVTYAAPFELPVVATIIPTVPYNTERVQAVISDFSTRDEVFRRLAGETVVAKVVVATSSTTTTPAVAPVATPSLDIAVGTTTPITSGDGQESQVPPVIEIEEVIPATNTPVITDSLLAPIAPPRVDN
jgi:hypothetical protein